MVEFKLYDIPQRMSLQDFCNVCKLPFVGDIHEPCPRDLEAFIGTICWNYAIEAIINYLLLHFLVHDNRLLSMLCVNI